MTGNEWTLCHDGSIQTNPDLAHSSKFELISSILKGNQGLGECRRVLKALTDTSTIQINESMGTHVHIGVQEDPLQDLQSLKHICQSQVN